MYIDYDYDYSLYNYEEDEWKTNSSGGKYWIEGGSSLRQESHRLSANVRAFLLGPKIQRDENETGKKAWTSTIARACARTREGSWRETRASERERKSDCDDCARVRGRAVLERNTLVYVFLVNSNSSIADFKSIYRYNDNINIIIVIIYDC